MSVNWVALLLVGLAVAAVVMGVRGTYGQTWAQLKALSHPAGTSAPDHTTPDTPHPGSGQETHP